MRQLLFFTIFLGFANISIYCHNNSPYPLHINIPEYANEDITLAYYYGNRIFEKAKIQLDKQGLALYSDIDHEGIYILIIARVLNQLPA